MKRSWQVYVIVLVCLVGFWWVLTPPEIVRPLARQEPQKGPDSRQPAQVDTSIPNDEALPPSASADASEGEIIINNKRSWKLIKGVRAIDAHDPLVRDIRPVGKLSGFVILRAQDVPAGSTPLRLVRRADNGLVGVFTGIIKAIGEKGSNTGSFVSDCPQGGIEESWPALKSYLLKASRPSDEGSYFDCLTNLGRFKRLEWEILDHPRSSR